MLNFHNDNKKRIITCFNKSVGQYESAASVQALVAKRLAACLSGIKAQNILEIGCGTGLFSQYLTSFFPNGSLILTDIAPAMAKVCQARFKENSRVNVMCLDGEILTLSALFDLIVSSMTLHWFCNLKYSLQAIISKLQPGGHFIFAVMGASSFHEWRAICKKFNIPSATPSFPTEIFFKNNFPDIKLETEIIHKKYASVYAFLDSLKNTGATATRWDYTPLPSGKLRRIMRSMEYEITMTYEIIYGHYIKT